MPCFPQDAWTWCHVSGERGLPAAAQECQPSFSLRPNRRVRLPSGISMLMAPYLPTRMPAPPAGFTQNSKVPSGVTATSGGRTAHPFFAAPNSRSAFPPARPSLLTPASPARVACVRPSASRNSPARSPSKFRRTSAAAGVPGTNPASTRSSIAVRISFTPFVRKVVYLPSGSRSRAESPSWARRAGAPRGKRPAGGEQVRSSGRAGTGTRPRRAIASAVGLGTV